MTSSLSPRTVAVPEPAEQHQFAPTTNRIGAILACLWLISFCVAFCSFRLPNNPQIHRSELLLEVPWILLECVDPTESAGGIASGWSFVTQRLVSWSWAAFIACSFLATGRLILSRCSFVENLSGTERSVLSFALGAVAIGTFTMICGSFHVLSRSLFLSVDVAAIVGACLLLLRTRSSSRPRPRTKQGWLPKVVSLTVALFVACDLLGSSLPPTDFDVREYHLQGPREFFESGAVRFLEHNVYTSFPFLTEMLSLHSMVLRNDWLAGALTGKTVLMLFGPLTTVAVFCIANRLFGSTAGWCAALVHATTPWVYRISIIAYAEGGLSFFLATTLLGCVLWHQSSRRHVGWSGLIAALSGAAMACKYPGLITVVIPTTTFAAVLVWREQVSRRRLLGYVMCLGLGWSLTIGPWLVRNIIDTGNPVYPLAYSVFGGTHWDSSMNVRWCAGHSPDDHHWSSLVASGLDVTLKSDWLSPLLFGLAAITIVMSYRRRESRWLSVYVGFLFLVWWGLTHRIDRFWVPMIPAVAVLSGAGLAWNASRFWTFPVTAVTSVAVLFNLAFVTTVFCGNNAYLADLEALTDIAQKPGIRELNRELPAAARVLCVGEAEVFDARFPLQYNTVFDDNLLERWCLDSDNRWQSAAAIRQTFDEQRITHIYVNWSEVVRYRNTYGLTEFACPETFQRLMDLNLIRRDRTVLYTRLSSLTDTRSRDEFRDWGEQLLEPADDGPVVRLSELYEVLP